MNFKRCFLALSLSLSCLSIAFAEKSYSNSMFVRALKDETTSPPFVLVSIQSKGGQRMVCLPVNLFLGALRMEYGGPATDARAAELVRFAISSKTREFIFRNPKAQRNVEPDYTTAQLEEVHRRLLGLSNSEIKAQVYDQNSPIHAMYTSRKGDGWAAYRNAIAHELLMRGIPAGIEDMTGRLYIS